MPTYRLKTDPPELLESDNCRVEGIHAVLRGTAYVLGRPCEVVVRRAPAGVLVSDTDVADDDSRASP